MRSLTRKTNQHSIIAATIAGFLLIAIIGCGGPDENTKVTPDSSNSSAAVEDNQADPPAKSDSDPASDPTSDSTPQGIVDQKPDASDDSSATQETQPDLNAPITEPAADQQEPSKPADAKITEPPANADYKETRLAEIPLPTEEEIDQPRVEVQTIDIPESWKRLSREHEIWIDLEKKQVIVAGDVCLVKGGLEMFICLFGTKEHESVIAVNALAFEVHASLLRIGAEAGSPVQWEPEYKKVTGSRINIDVIWKEGDKIVTRNGKELVRNFETKKELDVDWVFGGSFIEKDPESGATYYYGEGGELVCVSNFGSATMDLPIESSEVNANLMFEANTEKLPPRGTKVYVLFSKIPDPDEKPDGDLPAKKKSDEPAADGEK